MESADADAAAKNFAPPQGQANLYIVRDSAWPVNLFQLVVDGKVIGSIAASTFELLTVGPGPHKIAVSVEDRAAASTKVEVESDQSYFFQVVATPGWNSATLELKSLDADSGKALVNRGKLAANMAD